MLPRPRGLKIALVGGASSAIALAVAAAIRTVPDGSHLGCLLAVYVAVSALMLWVRPSVSWTARSLWSPASGDVALGAIAGGAVVGLSWCVQHFALPPASPQRAWLFQLALATHGLGDGPSLAVVGFLIVLEEWVWRGWVQEVLGQCLPRRWVVGAVAGLYAVVHAPTIWRLSDAQAGPNPLLLVAAFGLGWMLSTLRAWTARLTPGLVAHGVFAYFGVHWLLPG